MTAKERIGLSERNAHEVLRLIALDASFDLNAAGQSIAALLRQTRGESHDVIVENAIRLDLKAAASHSDIVDRWRQVSLDSALAESMGVGLRLRLARMLRLREGGLGYRLIRRV